MWIKLVNTNDRVHIYLTNDSIIIATWLREKRGPVRYAAVPTFMEYKYVGYRVSLKKV